MDAPIRFTLNAPVTYLITTPSADSRLYFNLQGAGNFFTGSVAVTGSITFSINNGAPVTISSFGNSFGFGALNGTDFLLVNFNVTAAVTAGDTVRLLADTLATTSNASGAPPASRTYQTFVDKGNGTRLDTLNGLSVPGAFDAGTLEPRCRTGLSSSRTGTSGVTKGDFSFWSRR